jgi:hypothetical protein
MERSLLATRSNTKDLTISAMLLAFGVVLPNFTGPQIGSILLPMHLPALLAGILVGKRNGVMVGMLIPLMRSFLFGMPPLVPIASSMALEMATYAFVAGMIFNSTSRFSMKKLYLAVVAAMFAGRIVFGLSMFTMLVGFGLGSGFYSMGIWFGSVFASSWIGIVLHLILIPMIVLALRNSGVLRQKN